MRDLFTFTFWTRIHFCQIIIYFIRNLDFISEFLWSFLSSTEFRIHPPSTYLSLRLIWDKSTQIRITSNLIHVHVVIQVLNYLRGISQPSHCLISSLVRRSYNTWAMYRFAVLFLTNKHILIFIFLVSKARNYFGIQSLWYRNV